VSNAASGKGRKAEMTDSKPPEQRDTKSVVITGAMGLALYLLLGIVLWWLLNSYVDPTAIKDSSKEATAKRDVIQALGFIMAGVAGAVGIFFTWRGQRFAREAQEQNQKNTLVQLKNAQEQLRLTRQSQEQNQQSTEEELRLTRQGQMTERFTQAVEQLGSNKLEIKLGAIYSLERTALEEQNYHWPVMEVLTSYVRQHAARKPDEEPEDPDLFDSDSQVAVRPTLDIQAILDVIGRRSKQHRSDKKVEYGTIDLSNTNLRGANLQKAYLRGANLKGTYLGGADLLRANLIHTDLRESMLRGAVFHDADLTDADFTNAKLERAQFLHRCVFDGAKFTHAHLEGAIFVHAKLRGPNGQAYFGGAHLEGADFRSTDITREQLGSGHRDTFTKLPDELARYLAARESLGARVSKLRADRQQALDEGTPEGEQKAEQLEAKTVELLRQGLEQMTLIEKWERSH
jgi:uncharacterized protein YjbI with pentapeptide repeats